MISARLSITVKLAAIHVLLVVSLLAVVAVAWRQLSARGDADGLDQLARAQRSTQNADMLHDALHSHVLSALLAARDAGRSRDAIRSALREDAQGFRAEFAALASMGLDVALESELDAARIAGADYVERAEQMVMLALSNPAQAAASQAAFDESFKAAKQALARQTELIARQLDAANAQTRRTNEEARRWLLLAALATSAAAWIGVALIARSIRLSLKRVQDVARAVAAGDLDRRSDERGSDEVGQLAQSVNQMADNLHRMIERMRVDADRGAFGARLVSALDMSDSESQAHEVVERAMAQIAPERPMELLLADSSDAHLERAAAHPLVGAPGCSVDSPFACVAVRRGHAISFDHSEALDACPKLRDRPAGAVSATCVPVTFMGRALGVLHACGAPERPLDEGAVQRLATLGAQLGSRIGTVRAFERTQLQASTDALTGLPNRRSIEARVHDLLRQHQSFAFVLADLDHFKRLNDTHGHQAGDEALRAFSDVVRENQRQADITGRWGGEEFAFVLVQSDAAQALQWVDRLRARLAQALRQRNAPLFTASFGIADSSAGPPLEAIVAAADRALYQAKTGGRDRGILAGRDENEALPVVRHSEQRAAVDLQQLAATA